ncbi:MAG: isoaspartyl peptidase/L-asparaginase, partial [Terriglobales bacterium]
PPRDWRELVTEERRRQRAREHGTVGAVARDAAGGLAAATSTGGMSGKLPGRVGDTPIIGAGTYADRVAAVSSTGMGESILRMALARLAAFYQEQLGDPNAAAARALAALEAEVGGEAGLILVAGDGRLAIAHNTPHMPACALRADGVVVQS